MTTDSVSIPTTALSTATRALLRASRFAEATALLDAAPKDSPDAELALARAEVVVAADWHRSRVTPADALDEFRRVVDASGTAATGWDLDFLAMRIRYAKRLFTSPSRRDDDAPAEAREVRERAEALREDAPDARRRGWAEMYLGLICDNVFGERDAAPAHYEAALAAARGHDDDHLTFEALRHLGDHAHDDGDHELTRRQWEDSARHAARAGLVSGTLAQLLLLAVTARDRGDEAGAVALATEVARWGEAIGNEGIRSRATGFVDGVDPTKEPEQK